MKRVPENDSDRVSNLTEENLSAKAEGKQAVPAAPERRAFLRTSLLGTAAIAAGAAAKPAVAREEAARASSAGVFSGDVPAFELDEVTISDLQDAMKSGKMHIAIDHGKISGADRSG